MAQLGKHWIKPSTDVSQIKMIDRWCEGEKCDKHFKTSDDSKQKYHHKSCDPKHKNYLQKNFTRN